MNKRRKARKAHKSYGKIIAAITLVIVVSVAVAAYVHFITSAAAIQTGPTIVNVDPTSVLLQSAQIGQTVVVNINVTNVRNLWGWELTNLAFNPKVLNLTQVQEGPFLKKFGPTFFITTLNDSNWVSDGILPSTNEAMSVNSTVHGSGVILTLTFAVLSAGTSPITINASNLSEPASLNLYNNHEIEPAPNVETGEMEPINCTVNNGEITIANVES